MTSRTTWCAGWVALLAGLAGLSPSPSKAEDIAAPTATPQASQPAAGPQEVGPPHQASRPAAGPQDPRELEAFLDGVIRTTLDDKHIGGAVVSVVRDGKPFFSKGYGFADSSHQVTVQPETTMFRIGSITKVFTFTALMQLFEQGKVDLNADVNGYLDFRLPGTFPQPITLAHLMTHTAGFEDRAADSSVESPDQLRDLREYLLRTMPARVRPPGQLHAYSNYGAALAGHAVEIVAGMPWAEYVTQKILQPLGMTHTSASQPLPATLEGLMSRGFRYLDGAFEPQGFELMNDAPAGTMSASAADMGRFMIAQLEGGCLEGACILKPETIARMHARQFTHDPRLNGWTYGLYEMSRNGRRVIGHGGDLLCFHALMALVPEDRLGIFVAANTDSAVGLGSTVLRGLMDHYYPVPPRPLAPRLDSLARARRFAGEYRPLRSNQSTWEKAALLLGGPELSVENDGVVVLRVGGEAHRFTEIEPLLYQKQGGVSQLLLREDQRGEPRHALIDSSAYEKLRLHESPSFHRLLHLVAALLFASTLFVALVGFLVHLERKGVRIQPVGARTARIALGLFALLALVYLACFTVITGMLERGSLALVRADAGPVRFMLGFGWALGVCVALPVWFAALGWVRGYWGVLGRLHYTSVALAAVAFVWSLHFWHLFAYL